MPIIPLCGSAAVAVPNPGRHSMAKDKLKSLSKQGADRVVAVLKKMMEGKSWFLGAAAKLALFLFKGKIQDWLYEKAVKDLGDAVQ